jgi:protein gp37
MSTTIEWTDETWNPVTGCSRISPGCKRCYAKALHDMRHQAFLNGKDMPAQYSVPFEVVQCHPDRLEIPLHWRAPRLCFVNSMADLFHEDVPFAFIASVLYTVACTRRITYQALTKRADRMLEFFTSDYWKLYNESLRWEIPNFWPGVSVESKRYLSRLDQLRQIPAACRMVSFEPLLEDLGEVNLQGIGWAIAGGESGPGARPMHPHWARSLRDQCVAAGVPFFFKQWGEWTRWEPRFPARKVRHMSRDGFVGLEGGSPGWVSNDVGLNPRTAFRSTITEPMVRAGKKHAGAVLDGREWREFPKPYPGHEVIRLQRQRKAVAA